MHSRAIALVAGFTASCLGAATNAAVIPVPVADPGFERAAPESEIIGTTAVVGKWFTTGGASNGGFFTQNAEVKTGTWAAEDAVTNTGASNENAMLWQIVDLGANKKLSPGTNVSAAIMRKSTVAWQFWVFMNNTASTTGVASVGSKWSISANGAETVLKNVTNSFVVPTTVSDDMRYLLVRMQATNNAGTLRVDDLVMSADVVTVPEPAMVGMLGVSSLAGLARRRRQGV